MRTTLHLTSAMLNEAQPLFRSEIEGSLTEFLKVMNVGDWNAFDLDDFPQYRLFHSAASYAKIKVAVRKHPSLSVWIVQRIK